MKRFQWLHHGSPFSQLNTDPSKRLNSQTLHIALRLFICAQCTCLPMKGFISMKVSDASKMVQNNYEGKSNLNPRNIKGDALDSLQL